MEYVRIKKEPGLDDDENPESVFLKKRNQFLQLHASNIDIVPVKTNDLEERTISGAIGRYQQRELLKHQYGEKTSIPSIFDLSDEENEDVSGSESGSGTAMMDDSKQFTSSPSELKSDREIKAVVKTETKGKGSGEDEKDDNSNLNLDVNLAKKKRQTSRAKERRTDNKRRKRNPLPTDTWLNKVSDSINMPQPLTDNDLIRPPKRNKYQFGFIGGLSNEDDIFIDENGLIQTTTHVPETTSDSAKQTGSKKSKAKKGTKTSNSKRDETGNADGEDFQKSEIDPQEEDLSLVLQEYYMKKDRTSDSNIDEGSVLNNVVSRGKMIHPNDTTFLSLVKETEQKKKDEIVRRGVSVPKAQDLYSKLSRMLIGERTEKQCILLTEAHLQQMTTVNEEFANIINMLMRNQQYNTPIRSLGNLGKFRAVIIRHLRSMEEPYLRQPIRGERPCIEGDDCEGRQIPGSPVKITCVEYQPMEEIRHYNQTGEWRGPQKHCLMCIRRLATFAYFYVKSQCIAYNSSMLRVNDRISDKDKEPMMIVPFSNIVGEGEYSPWDVLLSPPTQYTGLLEPIVYQDRRKYQQVVRNGVYYFEQKYEKPDRNLECRDTWDYDESWKKEISDLRQMETSYCPDL